MQITLLALILGVSCGWHWQGQERQEPQEHQEHQEPQEHQELEEHQELAGQLEQEVHQELAEHQVEPPVPTVITQKVPVLQVLQGI